MWHTLQQGEGMGCWIAVVHTYKRGLGLHFSNNEPQWCRLHVLGTCSKA